jgi:protein-tyrosine-phosphatase
MSDQPALRSVLLICTANQCRSPMAEALLKAVAAQRGEVERWQVQSAGTWTEPGRPATPLAQAVLQRRNLDLSAHRSRPLDAGLLAEAALVLVMTRHHQESIRIEFPEVSGKIYLLSQLIGRTFDIDDPYGGSLDDYEVCATELQNILTDGYDRLVELVEQAVLARGEGSVQQV